MGKEKWEAKPEWLFCKKLAVLAQKKKLTIWKVFLFSIFDPKKKEMYLGKPVKKIDG